MTDYSAITLERKGRMQMPIDLQVVSKKTVYIIFTFRIHGLRKQLIALPQNFKNGQAGISSTQRILR
jgi:hypothetical protein